MNTPTPLNASELINAPEHARLTALGRYRIVDTVPEQAYDDVVQVAACLLQTPIALLTLLEQDRQWFKAKIGVTADSGLRHWSLCSRLIDQPDDVLVVSDLRQDPQFMNSPLAAQEPYLRFYMGAALVTEDRHVIGSLCLFDTQSRKVTEQQKSALAALARQTMHLFELRLRNHEIRDLLFERSLQMQELSLQQRVLQQQNLRLHTSTITDALTGLSNRLGLDQHLATAFGHAQMHQQPLSVLLLDADHFKAYNDTFGHPAGDEVLRQMASLLQHACRHHDVAARYGGEEFLLILPNTSKPHAQQMAERLCQTVANTVFPHRAMTLSIGVATWSDGRAPSSLNGLIEAADQALYRAKRQGRNQVAVA